MDIIQTESEFKPITITLETREEANIFWGIMEGRFEEKKVKRMATKLSDWFCTRVHW